MIQVNQILHGSALEKLRELDSDSVDCVITSPPYWALRDYKTEGQLGLEPTFQEYITKLVEIFNEVKRVLKKTGSCWVNLGDTYNSDKWGTQNPETIRGATVLQRKDKISSAKSHTQKSLPIKSLCCIPERFAIAMIDAQWVLRNKIIWFKPNCMPSSAKDRFTVDFEYLFFFTKSQRYYFETQYEPLDMKPESLERYKYKFSPRKRDSNIAGREGEDNRLHNPDNLEAVRQRMLRSLGQWPKIGGNKAPGYENPTYSGNQPEISPLGRIKRCVWKIPTAPFSEAHFATFPPTLVKTPLLATCPEYVCKQCGRAREKIVEKGELILGQHKRPNIRQKTDDPDRHYWSAVATRKAEMINDTHYDYKTVGLTDCGCGSGFDPGVVMDPFLGSGTVALVALQHARNFIGIELSEEYINMAKERLEPYLLQTRLPI